MRCQLPCSHLADVNPSAAAEISLAAGTCGSIILTTQIFNRISACNPVLELHEFSLFTESSKYPRDRRAVMKFVAL